MTAMAVYCISTPDESSERRLVRSDGISGLERGPTKLNIIYSPGWGQVGIQQGATNHFWLTQPKIWQSNESKALKIGMGGQNYCCTRHGGFCEEVL